VRERKELLDHLARLRPGVIKPANDFIKYPYCIPGGFYDQQWDWDGFFIASHLAARIPPQPQYLKYWTLNVLASALPDGDVAACITPEGPRTDHRSLRLKPFIAQGAELAARLLDDYDWVAEHYEEIARIATRREATHFIDAYGLFVWEDAMQSGADNNPAIGNDPSAVRAVVACDINAFLYREYLALARLAARLGHGEDQVRYAAVATSLRQALNAHLWDTETESYWNLHAATGQWCKCVSYSNFVPLWAGMVPPERAQAMIRRYLWNDKHILAAEVVPEDFQGVIAAAVVKVGAREPGGDKADHALALAVALPGVLEGAQRLGTIQGRPAVRYPRLAGRARRTAATARPTRRGGR
jgi:alpha,alpha-trehalase